MLLRGKENLNLLNLFIVGLVTQTEIVAGLIDYGEIRGNENPIILEPQQAKTSRQLLEMYDNWAVHRTSYTLQQATEHFLHYGAYLRNEIVDTFGALVYDHYDDFSTRQLEALYRVYRDTLKRKYNIFSIAPSVLAHPNIRPSSICRYINENVGTSLRESSAFCSTIKQHDNSYPHTISTPVLNITRHMFETTRLTQQYPEGFSLPTILERLKSGHLSLTAGMVSGLLQSVEYDSFNDEVRAAEKNVMSLLLSGKIGSGRKQNLISRDQLQQVFTVNDLLKNVFEARKFMHVRNEIKSFHVLSQHISDVKVISPNIGILGAVYDDNTIHVNYLFDLILPSDVVDSDISDAKRYLLKKMQELDVVRKYLKVEKYQQSGPDQLLMEILRQMRDINFAPDLVTALRTHARFWHQSHMINNLNELLDLFNAYENLRNVPHFSNLMSLMDDIRKSLINSKIVTMELLCNEPRSCLQRGLKIVAQCTLVNPEVKSLLFKLFQNLNQDGSIYIDNCKQTTNRVITDILAPKHARSKKTGEVTSQVRAQTDYSNLAVPSAKSEITAEYKKAIEMIDEENYSAYSLEEDDSNKAYDKSSTRCSGTRCFDYFDYDSSSIDYFGGDSFDSSGSEEEQYHQGHPCIGKNCNFSPPATPSDPLSNVLVCSENECQPSNETNPWSQFESELTMTVLPHVQCQVKYPQYQKILARLEKIRTLDSIYATESMPTDAAVSPDENFSDESHGQSAPTTIDPQSSRRGLSRRRKYPQNDLSTRLERPRDFPFQPFSSHSSNWLKMENPVIFDDSYAESDMESGIDSDISALNVNLNTNVNLGSKNRQNRRQRNFMNRSPSVLASQTPELEMTPTRNADRQSAAVHHRVAEHSGMSNPSTMDSDIKKKRGANQMRKNHVPHETRSHGKMDVVRKHRSSTRHHGE